MVQVGVLFFTLLNKNDIIYDSVLRYMFDDSLGLFETRSYFYAIRTDFNLHTNLDLIDIEQTL